MFKYFSQLASESLIYGFSAILSRFLYVFLVPIYTRVFPPDDYGVLSLVNTTFTLLSLFAVLALDSAAARWYWDTEEMNDRKITLATWTWCQMAVSLVLGGAIFALSNWLGQFSLQREGVGIYFRLIGGALPLSTLGVVVTNWLRMRRRPWLTLGYALSISLINILLAILFVAVQRVGIVGVFLAQVLSAGAGSVVALLMLKDWINPLYFRVERLKIMLNFAAPLIPASLAYWIIALSGRYFVQFFSSTAEVGLYEVGNTVASAMVLITGAFQQAWGPFAMSIHKQPEARQVYASALSAYLWVTCLIGAALSLFASDLLGIFATESYLAAANIVGILVFSYVLVGVGYIAVIGPTIVKTTRPYGMAVFLASIFAVVLNFWLVPRLGKEGAALATLISQAVIPLYVFIRSQKLYPIPYRFGPAIALLALSLIIVLIGESWNAGSWLTEAGLKIFLVTSFFPAIFVFRILSLDKAGQLVRELAVVVGIKRQEV